MEREEIDEILRLYSAGVSIELISHYTCKTIQEVNTIIDSFVSILS
jgi:hypothetical protein